MAQLFSTERNNARSGWLAVLALWTQTFVYIGIVKGVGIMLPTLRYQFQTQTWVIGWMAALILATSGLVGPFAGVLRKRFGTGIIIMVCGLMIGTGAIAGSLAATAPQLAASLILLSGPGIGVMNVLAKDAIGRNVIKNYAQAVGVGKTGFSFGMIVYAPVIQLLLETYGWRATMLLTGGISLNVVVCGALLWSVRETIDQQSDYQMVSHDEQYTPHLSSRLSVLTMTLKLALKNLDVGLLGNSRYWSLAIITCCNKFAYGMWLIYFVSQAESTGFSLEDAAVFIAVGGVWNIVAKLGQGIIVDREILPCWGLMSIVCFISSLSYCVSPWLFNYWAMMVAASLIQFGDGVLTCLNDVLTRQLLGADLLAGAYGWIGVKTALLRILVSFIPGLLYDLTGNYRTSFLLIGSAQGVSLIFLGLLKTQDYV
ncbi:monocarboxylate transporter 12-like isoform X2 [Asterias amurensis]|uniref:monocarboxylate transporter 12-like isoform X2 n=1 Tax=Asterias amurensis TaxID=7602 RepID=UPI003AB33741